MKHQIKKILVTSIFLALTSTVYAGVETDYNGAKFNIYGNLDVGLASVSGMGATNSTANMVLNSPNYTSRIGFKGEEDLSDSLKAGFKLEHQILPGDGTNGVSAGSGSSNALFNLNSYVFLQSKDYGKLTVGRQNSITYNTLKELDPRGQRNFGALLSFWCDSSNFGGSATSKTGLLNLNGGTQVSNAITYELPTWKGITLQGMYVPGGVAGDNDASSRKALALIYKGIDHLTLVASQIQINNSTGHESGRTTTLGGNYKFLDDAAIVGLGYIKLENPSVAEGTANSEFTLLSVTGKYNFTKDFSVAGGWYELSDDVNSNNKATQKSIFAMYNLNKHVEVYTGYSQMDNEGSFGFAPMAQGQLNLNSLSTTYPSKVVNPGQTHDAIVAGMTIYF